MSVDKLMKKGLTLILALCLFLSSFTSVFAASGGEENLFSTEASLTDVKEALQTQAPIDPKDESKEADGDASIHLSIIEGDNKKILSLQPAGLEVLSQLKASISTLQSKTVEEIVAYSVNHPMSMVGGLSNFYALGYDLNGMPFNRETMGEWACFTVNEANDIEEVTASVLKEGADSEGEQVVQFFAKDFQYLVFVRLKHESMEVEDAAKEKAEEIEETEDVSKSQEIETGTLEAAGSQNSVSEKGDEDKEKSQTSEKKDKTEEEEQTLEKHSSDHKKDDETPLDHKKDDETSLDDKKDPSPEGEKETSPKDSETNQASPKKSAVDLSQWIRRLSVSRFVGGAWLEDESFNVGEVVQVDIAYHIDDIAGQKLTPPLEKKDVAPIKNAAQGPEKAALSTITGTPLLNVVDGSMPLLEKVSEKDQKRSEKEAMVQKEEQSNAETVLKDKDEAVFSKEKSESLKEMCLTYEFPEGVEILDKNPMLEENLDATLADYQVLEDNRVEWKRRPEEKDGVLKLWLKLPKAVDGERQILSFKGTTTAINVFAPIDKSAYRSVGGPVSTPQTIRKGDIAPLNYLKLIDNIPNARVQILGRGSGCEQVQYVNRWAEAGNPIWGGDWSEATSSIFTLLKTGEGGVNNKFGATSVKFSNSTPPQKRWGEGHWQFQQRQQQYAKDIDAGWRKEDLDLKTTNMWIKVRYYNAAYYKNNLVDAIATIKVTPMKNRTKDAAWGDKDYTTDKAYAPMIQFSDNLYRGWCWQNVREIQVNLQLIDKRTNRPIDFKSGVFGDMHATYYTINSLNEEATQGEENPAAEYGPEYVRPKDGSYTAAYVIPGAHVQTSYGGGGRKFPQQHAYNGGEKYPNQGKWDGDNPNHPNWSKHSVLFTTSDTNEISFTMGNLHKKPEAQDVYRTNFVWTSMSTESFKSNPVKTKDIPVKKTWSHQEDEKNHTPITVRLRLEYRLDGQHYSDIFQTMELSKENDWKGVFRGVPTEESMRGMLAWKKGINKDSIRHLEYKVDEVTVAGYKTTIKKIKCHQQMCDQCKESKDCGWEIHNSRDINGYQLPNTGASGIWWFQGIGFSLSSLSLAWHKRRRNRL